MTAWWSRHHDMKTEGYSHDEIEDHTGRIPLLLERCVVDGSINLNSPEINTVVVQSKIFVAPMKNTLTDQKWMEYVLLTKCFIIN